MSKKCVIFDCNKKKYKKFFLCENHWKERRNKKSYKNMN